jgi:nucleotide-binding universal stress UspA family protein
MYNNILLTLDSSSADRPIIDHIKQLATIMHSRVLLLHVATSASVQFHGSDAGGEEVERSRAYLDEVKSEFKAADIDASAELGFGEPSREIVKWAKQKGCDLIAMGTHGHRLIADLVLGTTASRVQHNISIPVLLLRAR